MGEVYKARDTRLNRTVAVKVLLQHVSNKPELQARFEREAQAIAALNHPNICTLHDVGRHEGTAYIVMEYLEGETLADRIGRGPLPLDQVFKYAIEIAGALDKAHRHGVTHRDLKPPNVMLTKSGVKLLDFGLAKLNQSAQQQSSSMSALPTNAAMTGEGMILGTLQYMAPEQLEGKEADARTDIFALGTLIHEMATGRKTFQAGSQASLIAAILDREPPPISSLQPMSPVQLDHIVKRCLAKEPDARWQAASDIHAELVWISQNPAPQTVTATATRERRGLPIWSVALVGALVAVIAGLAVWLMKPAQRTVHSQVVRLTVSLPPGERVAFAAGSPLAISPDGTRLVYVGGDRLYLRPMDDLAAKPIAGTEGAYAPFFSPDGQWIGFFAQGKLKKVSLNGGAPQTLADAANGMGGSWGTDGTIYFAPSNTTGLSKISDSGGTAQILTTLDRTRGDVTHRWPQVLPGNKAALFTTWSGPGWDEQNLEVLILESGERRVISRSASTGRYVSAGFLVYAQAGGGLLALPFDVSRLEATAATPVPLNVQINELGEGSAYAVSDAGVFAYLSGDQQFDRRPVWVDRKGNVEALPAPLRGYENANISPDGKFAAVQTRGPVYTVWIYDFARTTLTPLTTQSSQAPVWTPDGKRIVYRGTRAGFRNLYWKASDGSGEEERLTINENVNTPVSFSPDGKWLTFTENSVAGPDTWILPMTGDRKPVLFQKTSEAAHFSPDGRWIAYRSSDSGRAEIYVRPFQREGGRTQVSTDGGLEPVWSRDGRELFYINGEKTMAVHVQTAAGFSAGSPRVLFTGRYLPSPNGVSGYDISPDGQRFLKIQPTNPEQAVSQINVVINWFEELKRLTGTASR